MRIGIDGRMLGNTGIGRYLRNLLIHLAQKDRQNDYIVFINDERLQIVEQSNFTFVPLSPPIPIYSWREHTQLYLAIKRWKPDLMHYPNFDVPLYSPCPYVVTIHDLIYYLYPDQCPSRAAHFYADFMLRYAARHAKAVITVSEYSKQDLLQHFKLSADHIHVIYEAADDLCSAVPENEETETSIFKKYGIRQAYVLYVGKHHAYKNIETLIQAFARHKSVYEQFQLVIAGRRDERRKELYELPERLKLGERVVFTDFLLDEELFTLYRQAKLFVFPSFYEGFGLPPLEAMACGVPVIASSAASLPEVLGNSVIYFDPLNVDELVEAIRRSLHTKGLRTHLQQKGLHQARKFSWKTSALKHLELYERFSRR